jgi:hypothetical protein
VEFESFVHYLSTYEPLLFEEAREQVCTFLLLYISFFALCIFISYAIQAWVCNLCFFF